MSPGAWGFAIGPGTVLAASYLQKTLHYAPWQASALMIPGGLFALWLNILMGRLSDRIGRKLVIFLMMSVCGGAYAVFFSGVQGAIVPVLWIAAFFGYFTADSLIRSLSAEIVADRLSRHHWRAVLLRRDHAGRSGARS